MGGSRLTYLEAGETPLPINEKGVRIMVEMAEGYVPDLLCGELSCVVLD